MSVEQVFQTAQQEAYAFVREQIMTGAFSSGAHIKPADIAARLSLSRMPVREALRQLDAEGLVSNRPNRGAVVATLAAEDAQELIEACALLEALTLRYAMPNLVGEALTDLEALAQRMDRARGDPKTWIERHTQFHQFITDASGRRHIGALLRRIRNQLQPCTWQYIKANEKEEMEGYEHSVLIEAIKGGDVNAASRIMHDHVGEFGTVLARFLEQQASAPTKRRSRKAA